MNSTAIKEITGNAPNGKEGFWKQHAVLHKESGLSRAEYCRKNHLSYDCFGYWLCKWRKVTPKLVPINLKSAPPPAAIPEPLLCTLAFKSGRVLKIHDKNIIPLILSTLD